MTNSDTQGKPLNFVENENQVHKHLPGWMDGWLDGWVQFGRKMDGWTYGRTDGWKKERKQESIGWILFMPFKTLGGLI